jgi:prepilin-type N-terminal cleavage/methylation domain-containing protein
MKKNAGFTLMELMTVIAILAILIAFNTPNVFRWVSTQRFNSAVRDIQASIEDIRRFAIKENAQSVVTFTDGANNYETDKWKRGINDHDIRVHNLPSGVTISLDEDELELVFNSRGMVTDPAGNPIIDRAITINGPNNLSLDIVLTMTGSSRIS